MDEQTVDLGEKLKTVPEKPGVYMFKDRKERILYIGKARNLRNRLKSYFQQSAILGPRKTATLGRVRDFTFLVTETATLLLSILSDQA